MTAGGGGAYMIMVVAGVAIPIKKKGDSPLFPKDTQVREKARHAAFERRCAERATVRRQSPRIKSSPKADFYNSLRFVCLSGDLICCRSNEHFPFRLRCLRVYIYWLFR